MLPLGIGLMSDDCEKTGQTMTGGNNFVCLVVARSNIDSARNLAVVL